MSQSAMDMLLDDGNEAGDIDMSRPHVSSTESKVPFRFGSGAGGGFTSTGNRPGFGMSFGLGLGGGVRPDADAGGAERRSGPDNFRTYVNAPSYDDAFQPNGQQQRDGSTIYTPAGLKGINPYQSSITTTVSIGQNLPKERARVPPDQRIAPFGTANAFLIKQRQLLFHPVNTTYRPVQGGASAEVFAVVNGMDKRTKLVFHGTAAADADGAINRTGIRNVASYNFGVLHTYNTGSMNMAPGTPIIFNEQPLTYMNGKGEIEPRLQPKGWQGDFVPQTLPLYSMSIEAYQKQALAVIREELNRRGWNTHKFDPKSPAFDATPGKDLEAYLTAVENSFDSVLFPRVYLPSNSGEHPFRNWAKWRLYLSCLQEPFLFMALTMVANNLRASQQSPMKKVFSSLLSRIAKLRAHEDGMEEETQQGIEAVIGKFARGTHSQFLDRILKPQSLLKQEEEGDAFLQHLPQLCEDRMNRAAEQQRIEASQKVIGKTLYHSTAGQDLVFLPCLHA